MASKVDMSLDDLVQFGRKKGPQGKFSRGPQGGAQKTGKFQQSQNQNSKGPGGAGAGGAKPIDLRNVLAKKQKSTIGDLRSKLKPKALYTSKHSKSQPTTPLSSFTAKSPSSAPRRSGQLTRGHPITPMKPIRVDEPSPSPPPPPPPPPSQPSRRSDPGPISHKHRSVPSKLPSYDEAKKITVTVPGMRHPPSSSSAEVSHFATKVQSLPYRNSLSPPTSFVYMYTIMNEACIVWLGFFVLCYPYYIHALRCNVQRMTGPK